MRNINNDALTSAKTLLLRLVNTKLTAGGAKWLELAKSEGKVAPTGDSNKKTNAPGTYRQVGPTCPTTCKFLNNGCYAQGGPTAIQGNRSENELGIQLRGVAKAIAWAIKTNRFARLHVSGDFYNSQGNLDQDYIDGVYSLFEFAQTISGRQNLGWSYTHAPLEDGRKLSNRLSEVGLSVRLSDHNGSMGAVVADFNNLQGIEKPLKCLAQLSDNFDCDKCKACWEKPDHTIVFNPHGARKRAALNVIQG